MAELSVLLQKHYTYYDRKAKLAAYYSEQMDKYLIEYIAEKKAQSAFYKLVELMGKSNVQKEWIEQTLSDLDTCKGQGIRYTVFIALIRLVYYRYSGKYDRLINHCQITLAALQNRSGVYSSHLFTFHLTLGLASVTQRKYPLAKVQFQKAEQYLVVNTYNEYLLKYYQTISALHEGDYNFAYRLYRQNRKCKFSDIQQQFAITEAYFCFLNHTGYLQTQGRFRLSKYLNETFKAQLDKQGSNIDIIIAELLVHLVRDRGKFIDRVEQVEQYSYKYLRIEDTKRAKRLIKILCMIPRSQFDSTRLQQLASRHIQFLQQHKGGIKGNFTLDVIPYNDLLQMVLRRLNRKVA